MDPPYYDNVMYAELSDFFYVWLKRTAGHVFPELFRRQLTDNKGERGGRQPGEVPGPEGCPRPCRQGLPGADGRDLRRVPPGPEAGRHHDADVHAQSDRRVGRAHHGPDGRRVRDHGAMAHQRRSEGGLHIKNKAAAKSTVLLACRPRPAHRAGRQRQLLGRRGAAGRRGRAQAGQGIPGRRQSAASICSWRRSGRPSKSCPATGRYGAANPETGRKRRGQQTLLEKPWAPYAVSPEDALDVARREVKGWRLERLTHVKANADLDPATAFFVLAWDTFRAPVFDYDEALRLARAVGVGS